MAVRLSGLRTRRTLFSRNINILMFLVLISVSGWADKKYSGDNRLNAFKTSLRTGVRFQRTVRLASKLRDLSQARQVTYCLRTRVSSPRVKNTELLNLNTRLNRLPVDNVRRLDSIRATCRHGVLTGVWDEFSLLSDTVMFCSVDTVRSFRYICWYGPAFASHSSSVHE
jgi:hypothetical protein